MADVKLTREKANKAYSEPRADIKGECSWRIEIASCAG